MSVSLPHEPSVNLEHRDQTPTEWDSETPPNQNHPNTTIIPNITRAEYELLLQRVAATEATIQEVKDIMTEVKMVQREMFLYHRNQMMILIKQVNDYTTGRTIVVPDHSAPRPTNLEDSSIEGEKRVRE